ncbi:hypothetical protein LTR66_017101, partial [Elasticomyces elasticus]
MQEFYIDDKAKYKWFRAWSEDEYYCSMKIFLGQYWTQTLRHSKLLADKREEAGLADSDASDARPKRDAGGLDSPTAQAPSKRARHETPGRAESLALPNRSLTPFADHGRKTLHYTLSGVLKENNY